jgi:ATP-dependent RNA helicase RhlE
MYRQSSSRGGYGARNNNFRRSFRPQRRPVHTANQPYFVKKASAQVAEEQYVPQTAFADLPVDQVLKQNVLKKGYAHPTPIQDKAIMPILEGKDVIGIANTGTGKTAAFLIPLLNKVAKNKQEQILIIVPTRELATQIRDEMRSLSYGMNIFATLCIGGSFMRNQIYEIRRNPHFVIGTPGRLKDLIERKVLNISTFHTIVLDEVDRMLDMGFIEDIKQLIALLPAQRQSLFFSATISPSINTLIKSFTSDPVMVSVKKQDTADNVDQDIIRVQSEMHKLDVLQDLLKKEEFKKVIIFGRTKHGVEKLSVSLFQKGFKVTSIHGDKPQSKRNQAIRFFKENVVNILVATDVASRGIDIRDITHVINYDQPATYEDYIHRIGRTGRGNKKGTALTFVS